MLEEPGWLLLVELAKLWGKAWIAFKENCMSLYWTCSVFMVLVKELSEEFKQTGRNVGERRLDA